MKPFRNPAVRLRDRSGTQRGRLIMSTNHWYPRYVADYNKKTQHLSLAEHGAYALLMDYYYTAGKPSANAQVLYRICRAFESHEQEAVSSVVRQFFVEVDGHLSN